MDRVGRSANNLDERTFKVIGSLGAFQPGYQASNNDNDAPTRALIWTDKKQATPRVTVVSGVEVKNAIVTLAQVIKLGTESGNGYTGVEFDHATTWRMDPCSWDRSPARVA